MKENFYNIRNIVCLCYTEMILEVFYICCLACGATCVEFSKCYDDVNFCLWTDGSKLNQYEATAACQQRSGSLPRITNSNKQSYLDDFRSVAWSLLENDGFWIDVTAVSTNDFHWIDESSFEDGEVRDQHDQWSRFAVINYESNSGQFVFAARRWNSTRSSYICQKQGASCVAGDLEMNSKCYTKLDGSQVSWYTASKNCLSGGGSLAVFADIGRPSDSSQLTDWLTSFGTDKSYWIGLIRSWWKTTDENGRSVDVQYSNWQLVDPVHFEARKCVVVTHNNYWTTFHCDLSQLYVCQSYTQAAPGSVNSNPSDSPAGPYLALWISLGIIAFLLLITIIICCCHRRCLCYRLCCPPNPPTNVTVSKVSACSISLRWVTGNNKTVLSYVVEFRAKSLPGSGDEAKWRKNASVKSTECTVYDLVPSTEYELRVRAFYTFARSLPSDTVNGATSELESNEVLKEKFHKLHDKVVHNIDANKTKAHLFAARVIGNNILENHSDTSEERIRILNILHDAGNPEAFVQLYLAINKQPNLWWLVNEIDTMAMDPQDCN